MHKNNKIIDRNIIHLLRGSLPIIVIVGGPRQIENQNHSTDPSQMKIIHVRFKKHINMLFCKTYTFPQPDVKSLVIGLGMQCAFGVYWSAITVISFIDEPKYM